MGGKGSWSCNHGDDLLEANEKHCDITTACSLPPASTGFLSCCLVSYRMHGNVVLPEITLPVSTWEIAVQQACRSTSPRSNGLTLPCTSSAQHHACHSFRPFFPFSGNVFDTLDLPLDVCVRWRRRRGTSRSSRRARPRTGRGRVCASRRRMRCWLRSSC